jgi:hypothetical protein
MYYDSCYLYSDAQKIDHEYRYVIWSGDKDKIHVSCWNMYSSKCVFVLKPEKIISKYMTDMDYTDFANSETRYGDKTWSKDDIAEYNRIRSHAQRIVDILTSNTN